MNKHPDIDKIIDDIIKAEGGYNDIEEDKGGATNLGISLRYIRGIGFDVDGDGDIDKDDIREVDYETAANLYLKDFYIRPRINTLPYGIQPVITDFGVNSGPGRAIITLQNTLNIAADSVPEVFDYGYLKPDGGIGPKTRGACEQAWDVMGSTLINAYTEERIKFYKRIVERDPSQRKFLRGWINRSEKFYVS